MRVLLISHTCQSATEGQPKAEWLGRSDGVELCVLVPDRWKHYGQWRVPQLPERPSFRYEVGRVRLPWVGPAQYYLHHYGDLATLLRELRPDVIDLWEEPWGLVSVQACRLRRRLLPSCKVVSETEQNIDKALPFPFERFRSYTLSQADFVIGRSSEAVEVVRRKGYRGPAEVVPNAVDAELFRPLDRDACRQSLGVSGGFVVGYAGRLVEEKGLDDLVEAIALCPESVRLILLGTGPREQALRDLAAGRGVAARVTFLPARPLAELPAFMNALDAFVLPSRTTASWKEQFGRVIIEAHACRIPVIGTRSGAIPDVVGGGGLVVPERDPAALAGAIRALADDAATRARLAGAGYEQAQQTYTWRRVAERMRCVYERVTAG